MQTLINLLVNLALALGLVSHAPIAIPRAVNKPISIENKKPVAPKLPEPILENRQVSVSSPEPVVIPSQPLTKTEIYYQPIIEPDMSKKQVTPGVSQTIEPAPEPASEAPQSPPERFNIQIEMISYPSGYTLPNDGTGPSGTKVLAFKVNEAIRGEITVQIYTRQPGLSFSNIMLDGTKLELVSDMLYRLPTGTVINSGDVYLAGLSDVGPYTAEIKIKSLEQTCGNCNYPATPIESRIELQP